MKKIFVSVFALFILSCSENNNTTTEVKWLDGLALGTFYRITYISDTTFSKETINDIFDTINNSFSIYHENSEISIINKSKKVDSISDMFREVFLISKEINEKTDGWFDPTVGLLVRDLGLSVPNNKKTSINIENYKKYIGFEKINLIDSNKIIKNNEDIFIDFNAIAKGFAVDYISYFFDKNNIKNYLIEIGGEIITKGKKLNGDSWKIGIDKPNENLENREVDFIINLENRAIATSGNYRKFMTDSLGNKIVHTINPKTLDFFPSKILSVSVLHERCTYADAFATAILACGDPEEAKNICDKNNIDAYIIYLDQKNNVKKYITKGFEKLNADSKS